MSARTSIRTGLFGGAALAATLLAVPPAAAAECVDLRGAAASMFDQHELCRNLRSEFTARKPDSGRALRKSIRGAPEGRPATRAKKQARKAEPGTRPRRPGAGAPALRTAGKPRAASDDAGGPRNAAPVKPTPQARTGHAPAAPAPTVRVTVPVASGTPGEGGVSQSAVAATVTAVLLLSAFAVYQRTNGPLPALPRGGTAPRVPARRRPSPATPPACAAATAAELARPAGLGVVGPGANGFMRAALVELLTRDAPRTKVVISRNELNRLFESGLDDSLMQALACRLHVCDLLEETIEHLELEMLMAEAERANPDLSPTRGRDLPRTYWICTPGQDDDVVLPLIRRGPAHRLTGLMFGAWPHGRTCAVDAAGVLSEGGGHGDTQPGKHVPTLSAEGALARLRAHATSEHGAWF